MSPIATLMGGITHKPAATVASAGQAFAAQLQAVQAPGPDRATIGHPHGGGMNDVLHHIQAVGAALSS